MPQGSVTTVFPAAFVGMEPDLTEGGRISRVSGETTLQIPFGVVVVQGTDDLQCRNIAAQADAKLMLGVVPYQPLQINHELAQVADSNGNLGALPGTALAIKAKGRLWVQIDETVSQANKDPVKVRTANASAGVGPGTFGKTSHAGNTLDLSDFARWVGTNTYSASTPYGLLEFDFTMAALASSD